MNETETIRCWVCNNQLKREEIKYHTPIQNGSVKVFCDAYCSVKYYEDIKCKKLKDVDYNSGLQIN